MTTLTVTTPYTLGDCGCILETGDEGRPLFVPCGSHKVRPDLLADLRDIVDNSWLTVAGRYWQLAELINEPARRPGPCLVCGAPGGTHDAGCTLSAQGGAR